MSIVDGFRTPNVPAASGERETLRVLVAVETQADARLAARRLRRLDVSYRCSVTLLGVARSSFLVRYCAPLSGLTTPYDIALAASDSARRLARTAAAEADIPGVDHLGAVAGWDSRCLIEPLRLGVYDALLLGSLPRGRFSRRRLLGAAHASGTTVLVDD
jgi:nucleotide-binding universal stress UspA family protein